MPTNLERSAWALAAVQALAEETGLSIEDDGLETAVTDLLANVMHLCQLNRIDFDSCLSTATDHYSEEKLP